MKTKTPLRRRKFANEWDEIGYLYDKLLYWLFRREDKRRALPYAHRLERVLATVAPGHQAIFGEECWSLVYEAKADLTKAIKHRENEIRLIRRLHDISRKGDPALKDYAISDLSDRLDLLAMLYRDSGNLERAIALLRESKQLCESHAVPFDGEDLLQEYLTEKRHNRNGRRLG